MTTNGVPLDEKKTEGILKSGVDKVTISLLASDALTYSEITGKKKYDQVVDNVKALISKKIGRNDPCPCGSGKKYKICHGS